MAHDGDASGRRVDLLMASTAAPPPPTCCPPKTMAHRAQLRPGSAPDGQPADMAFFQLLLGPANAAFSGFLLLRIFDPADELVAGQRRDVLPGIECGRVGDQRHTQVSGKLVHDATGNSQAAHRATLANQIGQEISLTLDIHNPYAEIVGQPLVTTTLQGALRTT